MFMLAHEIGGRDIVEFFRNLIGTPDGLYYLCSHLSHLDNRPNEERRS
jgi:hypothetical protein